MKVWGEGMTYGCSGHEMKVEMKYEDVVYGGEMRKQGYLVKTRKVDDCDERDDSGEVTCRPSSAVEAVKLILAQ